MDNGRCIGRKEVYPWVWAALFAGAGITEAIQIGIKLYRDHKNKINKEVENTKQKALEEMEKMEKNEKSCEEENLYTGETPPCPRCGEPLTKKYVFSRMYCTNCGYGLDDDNDPADESESLSVYDAAVIWASHGKDEDYTFGYTEEKLEDAL